MKVVHTYTNKWGVIPKEEVYIQVLSAILAKKHYGNITFCGNKATVEQVKQLPFDYDEYIVLDDFDYGTTFSYDKIVAFGKQEEEFLHIDTDTLLFNKINFDRFNSPFVFAYPDRDSYTSPESTVDTITALLHKDPKQFHEVGSGPIPVVDFLFDTYLQLFLKIKQPSEHHSYLDLQSIPNMNMFYARDIETVKKASQFTLKHYYRNQDDINDNEYGACYIEQLIFNIRLRELSEEYRTESTHMRHTVFGKEPFNHDYSKNIEEVEIADWSFPYDIKLNALCEHCETHHNLVKTVKSASDLTSLIDYDFGGYWHATYYKRSDAYQAVIMGKLEKELGVSNLRMIHELFKKWYKHSDNPEISSGEIFYEKLTGKKVFTNAQAL